MKVFFIVGNKRSGTSLLVRLLNLHPEVFCSQESDIPYVLYRMAQEPGATVDEVLNGAGWSHPRDDDNGMCRTLKTKGVGDLLAQPDPVTAFHDSMSQLMRNGNKIQDAFPEKEGRLRAIGDKKPVQYADPDVRSWLDDVFDPVYLHSVRHPRECIRSMHELGLLKWWKDPLEEVGEMWAEHERWALDIDADRRLTYRYEDLLGDPVGVMRRVFSHLGLLTPANVSSEVRRRVSVQPPRAKDLSVPYTSSMREVMQIHGYDTDER